MKIQWLALAVTAILVLLGSRTIYRFWAAHLYAQSSREILPAIPLRTFPYSIGPWDGVDVPISETVLKVAANDDYLSRSYTDPVRHLQSTLYVAYTAEPRRMLGHRPRVCYVGSGWVHDNTQEQILQVSGGRKIPCLVHRFHKTGLAYQEIVVWNYYVVNGDITSDYTQFTGLRWRRPKMNDGRVDYVAQVQISSASEVAAEKLMQDLTEAILRHFLEKP